MNRIVREHYPAARLPEDLRDEIGLTDTVTLTIEPGPPQPKRTAREAVMELLELRKSLRPSADDSVERVSRLRDEWDARSAE